MRILQNETEELWKEFGRLAKTESLAMISIQRKDLGVVGEGVRETIHVRILRKQPQKKLTGPYMEGFMQGSLQNFKLWDLRSIVPHT